MRSTEMQRALHLYRDDEWNERRAVALCEIRPIDTGIEGEQLKRMRPISVPMQSVGDVVLDLRARSTAQKKPTAASRRTRWQRRRYRDQVSSQKTGVKPPARFAPPRCEGMRR